jgi:hypothetical protein
MHSHDTGYGSDWDWQPRQNDTQMLTLLLTRRMSAQLQAIAHDLELPPDEAAFHLLRDTLWSRYHLMQHF